MILVFCNCPSNVAESMARALVEERLAACVNISAPVTSIYSWKGKMESEIEQTLLIKTVEDRWKDLQARIEDLHPYEVPEIVKVHAADVNASYLAWVQEQTSAV